MNETETKQVRVCVDEKPVIIHFDLLEDGDVTVCIIRGGKTPKSTGARIPVTGVAVRNPADKLDANIGMKLACWRACFQVDGEWRWTVKNDHEGRALGPVGRKIYSAFRHWLREQKLADMNLWLESNETKGQNHV